MQCPNVGVDPKFVRGSEGGMQSEHGEGLK